MKRQIFQIFAVCMALLAAACEKDAIYGPNEGGISLGLAGLTTRAVDTAGQTIDDCTIYIYQKESDGVLTLVRKYAPGNCPATVKLLAGSYTAKVQWGEAPDAAAFDKCFYEGTADFTVASGKTTSVQVHCYPQSAVVQVTFEYLAQAVTNASVKLSLHDSSAPTASLEFTEDETGYFTVPEEGARLDWAFSGYHAVKGGLYKSSSLQVEAGKKYGLAFRYSDDLPGYIEIEVISVDLTEEKHDDLFVFSKQPEVRGDLFSGTPEYADEEMELTMAVTSSHAKIRRGDIYLAGIEPLTRADSKGTQLFRWVDSMGAAGEENNVRWQLSEDERELNITLTDAFFNFPLGDVKLTFEVEDTNDNTGEKSATVRMNRGIRQVEAGDYDLWTNTFTAYGVSTGGTPTFKLRKAGTETWRELPGVAGANGEYTALFTPEWEESYNSDAETSVYRLKTAGSVCANNTYELAAVIDGHEYITTFSTPCDQPIVNADMSDSSQNCFNTNHGTFWDSGNNTMTKSLCTQSSKTDASGKTWSCASLNGGSTLGVLSAGNLFTGKFSMSGTTGTVDFGKPYDWQARPTALHVKYHATIGAIDVYTSKNVDETVDLKSGDQDNAVIYVAIIDWDNTHAVASGTGTPSGMWSPANLKQFREKGFDAETGGTIIGYGLIRLGESTQGDNLVDLEIPIYYYDTVAKPSKEYTIIISSSTSYFGDYMVGCSKNKMFLTDFSWVY